MAAPVIIAGAKFAMKIAPWVFGTIIVDKITDRIPTPPPEQDPDDYNTQSPVPTGFEQPFFTVDNALKYGMLGTAAYIVWRKFK